MVWPAAWGEIARVLRSSRTAVATRPNPGLTPEALLATLGQGPVALLDGVSPLGAQVAMVAWNPLWRLQMRSGLVTGAAGAPLPPAPADPLALIDAAAALLPGDRRFPVGIIGMLGYDALTPDAPAGASWPDAWFMYPGALVVFSGDTVLLAAAGPGDLQESLAQVEAQVALAAGAPLGSAAVPAAAELHTNLTRAQYMAGVERIRAEIAGGNLRKAVLSLRFAVRTGADPVAVYRRLAQAPGALRFFLRDGADVLLGVTPELLVSRRGRRCLMRPLAGTRRRGATGEEDRALLADLQRHPKDTHEHLVAVEQAVQDLSAVCEPDSVGVSERLSVEIYPTVMHLASQVEGVLRPDLATADLIRSVFPAGTVAGVPRREAMALLRSLEPTPRGAYAGGIGYWLPDSDLQLFLSIRCLQLRDGLAHVQTGAGVVSDSDPAAEHRECWTKAAATLRALGVDDLLLAPR